MSYWHPALPIVLSSIIGDSSPGYPLLSVSSMIWIVHPEHGETPPKKKKKKNPEPEIP
jgi:hypothetical protein